MPHPSAGQRLRDAWRTGAVMSPDVINALMGRMAERQGFHAIYLSGAALSASYGLPAVGLVTQTEFITAAQATVEATSLPHR